VWVDGISAKIRGLFDDKNKATQKILPGEAALIMGFSQLPQIGSQLRDLSSTDNTRVSKKNEGPISTDGKIPLVIKAQSAGVLEALMASLPEGVVVVSSGVGDVTESDVFFAKTAKAHILLFEVKVTGSVAKLAETEGIKIEKFSIIYELLDRVNDIVKASQDEVLGKAEVLDIFPYENKKVAGCKIKEGKISINDKLIINRGETVLGEAKAVSLKRGKQDITEAKAGEECGILFVPQLDFARGDVILSVKR
jgi:translation initiation factor IF-2